MSHFYATIPTSARKTAPTARGHKSTGVVTIGASWDGAIETKLWHNDETGLDWYQVEMIPWHGRGEAKIIARGPVGERNLIDYHPHNSL